MKKPLIIVAGILLLAALAVLQFGSVADEQPDTSLILYGNVDIREVQLGFRVSGRLQEMSLEEGDAVVEGNLLASLDDLPFAEALAVDEAQLQKAQFELQGLENGSRPQEISLARARVEAATALLTKSQQDLERQQQLIKEDVGSQRLLDAALAMRNQARAELAMHRANLDLAIEGPRQEDLAAARAAVSAAEARKSMSSTRLQDTTLYSPANGTIMTRVREPGAMLSTGEPVYVLSLTDVKYVRAYVEESQLGNVRPGTAVNLKTDSSDKRFKGQIGFVSPRAEFTPKTVETAELRTDLVYRLRIVVDDTEDSLRQGMPVTIEVALNNNQQ